MTVYEQDILDELHFVQSFGYLLDHTQIPEEELKDLLWQLAQKGWVKILETVDQEVVLTDVHFEYTYQSFYYLASKQGLLAYHMNYE